MPTRFTVAATAVTALLAGCTARPTDQASTTRQPTRDINLIEPATAPEPKVSDLEAGRPQRPVVRPRAYEAPVTAEVEPSPPVESAPVAAPNPLDALAAAPEAVPAVSRTTTATFEASMSMGQSRLAAITPDGERVRSVDYGSGEEAQGDGTGRRWHGVMIRGGLGGPDDDCAIHHRGGGRAINRVAPSLSGSIGTQTTRIGLGGMVGGFTRRGIP